VVTDRHYPAFDRTLDEGGGVRYRMYVGLIGAGWASAGPGFME
jgi:hypothetical protein